MKFKKKFVTYRTAEVKTVKAAKDKCFIIPIWDLERELTRKVIFKLDHFFNEQGSVCAVFNTVYEVYRDDWYKERFVTKSAAIKCAKEWIKD